MINFAVINFKSTIKNLSKIIIVLLLIIGIVNLSDLIRNINFKISYLDFVKSSINFNFNNEKTSFEKIIFCQEMPILATAKSFETSEIEELGNNQGTVESIVSNDEISENIQNLEVQNTNLRNLPIEVVSENNLSENYNTLYGSVKIKNETSFELTNEILTPNVEFTNKTDVVIFHTHTCESYTETEANSYVPTRKL